MTHLQTHKAIHRATRTRQRRELALLGGGGAALAASVHGGKRAGGKPAAVAIPATLDLAANLSAVVACHSHRPATAAPYARHCHTIWLADCSALFEEEREAAEQQALEQAARVGQRAHHARRSSHGLQRQAQWRSISSTGAS